MHNSNRIDLKTLGRFAVSISGRYLPITRSKHKALLAYLFVNKGRTHSRDHIVDLLWQESSQDNGRHSLNQALSHLRRLIPVGILSDNSSIWCDETQVTTDCHQLLEIIRDARIAECLPRIPGTFLPDIQFKGDSEFEDWRSAFSAKIFRKLESGIRNELIASKRDDQRRRLLHYAAELSDLLPGFQKIAPIQSPLPLTEEFIPSEREAHPPIHAGISAQLPLVGRQPHFDQLAAHWTACCNGSTQYVAIEGGPGLGKTRLVDEFIEYIGHKSSQVMRARCYESERRIGFAPILGLFSRNISDNALNKLEPVYLSAVAQLLPVHLGVIALPQLSESAAQSRLSEGVLRLLTLQSSEQPLFVFLDDAQWADNSTRALLSYVSHRLCNAQIMFVAAVRRSTESRQRLPWQEWTSIGLQPFKRDEIQVLLDKITPQFQGIGLPSAVSLVRMTGGTPYFVAEAIRACVAGDNMLTWQRTNGIKTAESILGDQFGSASADAQRILAFMAVLGRPAPPTLLRSLTRTRRFSAAIDELSNRGLVTTVRERVALSHDLIRESIYARIPNYARSDMHRRVAEVVKTKHTGEAAEHFYRSGARRKAYAYAILAANEAVERAAHDASISFLRLAVRAKPKGTHNERLTLAQRLFSSHRWAEAKNELDLLISTTGTEKLEIYNGLRVFHLDLCYNLGQIGDAPLRRSLEKIKQDLDEADHVTLVRVLRLLVRSSYHTGDIGSTTRVIQELRSVASRYQSPQSAEATAFAARVHGALCSAVEASEWVRNVDVQAIADPEMQIAVLSLLSGIAYEAGELKKAEDLSGRVLADIERVGAINLWPVAAAHAHMLAVEQGVYTQAIELANQISIRAAKLDAPQALVALHANEAIRLYEMEDFEAAEAAALSSTSFLGAGSSVWVELALAGVSGLIALALGKTVDANRMADECRETLDRIGFHAGDLSHAEILIFRTDRMRRRGDPPARLRRVIQQYENRDPVCRMRMELEMASALRITEKQRARSIANRIFREARAINANPLADRADSLLYRI